MIIFLTGATGFLGARLEQALSAAGHVVMAGARDVVDKPNAVQVDFTRDLDPSLWVPRLSGVDVVVNAVGILREHGEQTFARIHTLAPKALFEACVAAGVSRVVQISALGADTGTTGYFASKRAADEYLATLPLQWTIIQPALVYGEGGTSARLFTLLASLPIVPIPGDGCQQVQPIYVDDLIEAIVEAVTSAEVSRRRVPLVGPRPLALREFLRRLRQSMTRSSSVRFLPVPMTLMRLGARIMELASTSLLDRETLAMLQAGNSADVAITERLLGRPPRPVESFIETSSRAATLMQARLSWLLPLLRMSVALVWIWTGIVSLGLYPLESSYDLLGRAGISHALAPLFLYSAALLDLVFGVATLLMKQRSLLWLAQIATILVYTLVISVALPEFWLHPYGPVLKNLPLLAALYLLYSLETPP
jgi:uncharacterized protein YbjT (DUF2867 family)